MTRPPAPDWSIGHYEHTATQLEPAAQEVVTLAAPQAGEHVVDVGCGTGNAALLAARQKARVTGVDPARRLLDVAAERAQASGLDAQFEPGEASGLPLPDDSADVVLSVFGVIFAPDPRSAIAELTRVAKPNGRIVISAWIPEGPISEAAALSRRAVMRALGAPAAGAPFPWHQQPALSDAFGEHGFTRLTLHERRLAFTAHSPAAYLDNEFANHPLWIGAAGLLEPRGELPELKQRVLQILEAGNEDPAAFRVTSRYVVAVADRGSSSD